MYAISKRDTQLNEKLAKESYVGSQLHHRKDKCERGQFS